MSHSLSLISSTHTKVTSTRLVYLKKSKSIHYYFR